MGGQRVDTRLSAWSGGPAPFVDVVVGTVGLGGALWSERELLFPVCASSWFGMGVTSPCQQHHRNRRNGSPQPHLGLPGYRIMINAMRQVGAQEIQCTTYSPRLVVVLVADERTPQFGRLSGTIAPGRHERGGHGRARELNQGAITRVQAWLISWPATCVAASTCRSTTNSSLDSTASTVTFHRRTQGSQAWCLLGGLLVLARIRIGLA